MTPEPGLPGKPPVSCLELAASLPVVLWGAVLSTLTHFLFHRGLFGWWPHTPRVLLRDEARHGTRCNRKPEKGFSSLWGGEGRRLMPTRIQKAESSWHHKTYSEKVPTIFEEKGNPFIVSISGTFALGRYQVPESSGQNEVYLQSENVKWRYTF